jgi:transposase
MYIRKTWSVKKEKRYENYVLVESVLTPKGPRQKHICTLGNLSPRPREEWLKLVGKVEDALAGQERLYKETDDAEVSEIVKKVTARREKLQSTKNNKKPSSEEKISVYTDRVSMEQLRQAGPVHVGYQFWRLLKMDEILENVGLKERASKLVCAMVMNRLIHPGSENAMADWFRNTAIEDILQLPCKNLAEDRLYRMLDSLHPNREKIEQLLAKREQSLFGLKNTIIFYDLTSTYFEGQAFSNNKAQRGYSRDGRPDCKQVVIGLVIGQEGFPIAHEIFKGNQNDASSLSEMLDVLDNRVGLKQHQTVVIDRGIASKENLKELKRRNLHYIVASRHTEREQWWDIFYEQEGFSDVNPGKDTCGVKVKKMVGDGVIYVLCESKARSQKDRAIRQRFENNLLKAVEKLKKRIETGRLQKQKDIQQAIGRLKERYSRSARYYKMDYQQKTKTFTCTLLQEKKQRAEQLDGCYILKTDRTDIDAQSVWQTYMMLTRAESAFRSMKSPLAERPIFHQLQQRVETHIFLCILAYHLLVAIEKTLKDAGEHTSWETVREKLKTHQIGTVVLPTDDNMILKIRKGTHPEPEHIRLYSLLGLSKEIIKPRKIWVQMTEK